MKEHHGHFFPENEFIWFYIRANEGRTSRRFNLLSALLDKFSLHR